MNTQTLLNCPGCLKEQLCLINITLSSNDRYQLSYYCKANNSKQIIEIDKYLSSIIKRNCGIHPYTNAIFCLDQNTYLCKDCFTSRMISNRSDTKLNQKTTKKCQIHRTKKIKNHCDKCNVDVCKECILKEHINHCDWVHLTKNDLDLKGAFKKEFSVLSLNIKESTKKIDESINNLEITRKHIIQAYNQYLNVNLPILNLYELLLTENQNRPHNSLKSAIKAFSFDLINNSEKVISRLKNEIWIIKNSTETITKNIEYLFQLSSFTFKSINYNSKNNSSNFLGYSSSNKNINLTACDIKSFNQVSITLKDHIGTIYSLIQLANGNFASSSADGTIKFWDSYSFKLIYSILAHTESVNIIREIKENVLASCSNDNTLKIWYLDKDTLRLTTIKEMSPIISIESLSNDLIVSFFSDMINVWNINTQFLTFSKKMSNSNYIIKIIKNTFASSMNDYSIMVFDLFDSNQSLNLIGHSDTVSSLIPFKSDYIISGSFDRSIRVWSLNNQQCCIVFNDAHLYAINCLVELKDGRLASGSNDKVISIWDLDYNQCNANLIGHEGAVRSLIQLANGKIVSGSSDETIKIWE